MRHLSLVGCLILVGCVKASSSNLASDEPPHVPSFCSGSFCLEVALLHDENQRRFIKPTYEMTEVADRSQIKISFEGFGQVTVGEYGAQSTTALYAGSLEVRQPCSGEQPCRLLKIAASDVSDQATIEELKCKITRIWFLKKGTYYTHYNSIGLPYTHIVSLQQVGGVCRVADRLLD